MKNGLFFEDDKLVYYKNDHPYHAGVIQVDDDIYYIDSHGCAVKGQHIIHREMGNGILVRGTYKFGEDYKLIKNSYVPPKEKRPSLKKISNYVLSIALILLFCVAFFLIARTPHPTAPSVAKATESTEITERIILPVFSEDVLLCSQAAKLEYDGDLTLKEAVQTGDPYRPLLFEYQLAGAPGILRLSENPQMEDARIYELPAGDTVISIDNLKVDTDYFYEVLVKDQTYSGSFHTAPSTRFVSIPGLTNTRDIGGYTNQDGQTVKQGLLIRGVELDGLVNAEYFIPEEALASVHRDFGFVYDLDLREPTIYSGSYTSRLNVPHRFYNSPMYGTIFNQAFVPNLRQIFSDLADPEKYPMYLHCTWGRDRTGTIVFLLQGILNLSEEDMLREYRLTGYQDPAIIEYTGMDPLISGLESYAGVTLNEKIVTYLTTVVGVTEQELESIRSIFLEGLTSDPAETLPE